MKKKQISTCGITDIKMENGQLVTLSIDQRVSLFKDFKFDSGTITQVKD